MVNKIPPAYLAGVIDSDGSISITKRHLTRKTINYTVMVQLTWKNKINTFEFMKQLQSQYGGNFRSYKKWNSCYTNSCPVIKYCGVASNAERILNDILPYLFLKKNQALAALEVIKIIKSRKHKVPRTKETSSNLNRLYTIVKASNDKNKYTQVK